MRDPLVALDLQGDLGAVDPGRLDKLVVRQVETGRVDDGVERGESALGELRLREIVRHVDGIADRVAALLTEAQLEEGGEGRRDLDGAERGLGVTDESRIGGVRRDPHRTGVQDGHGDAVRRTTG